MDDDLIRRRKERLGPEARELVDDINLMGVLGAEIGGPEFEELLGRLSELPIEEQRDLIALLEVQHLGSVRRVQEAQEIKETTEGAKRVFEAAHEKLRTQRKPIDPNMTLREAYEVLGFT